MTLTSVLIMPVLDVDRILLVLDVDRLLLVLDVDRLLLVLNEAGRRAPL